MAVIEIFDRLFQYYGQQFWWPGETPFEIIVGAILTQNTAWINVEKAIQSLRDHAALDVETMDRLSLEELAELIRSAGYFRIKARRLKKLHFVFEKRT